MTISPTMGSTEAAVQLTRPVDRLSFRQAMESPCASCQASYCCTHLLLVSLEFNTLMDVDNAIHMSNFEGIFLELGTSGRTAQVYLHQPCRYLDVPTGRCTVYRTPLQPSICVHYSSHSCGYREVFSNDLHPEHPMLDARRMAWMAEHMVFDDDRRLVSIPDRDEMLEAFRAMPVAHTPMPAPGPNPMVDEWRSIVLSTKGFGRESRPVRRYSDWEVMSPCTGCEAWCCKYLVFERGLPQDMAQLDFIRFSLGFPSVELGITSNSWNLLVRTTCRHLDGNRCSVYGTAERPLQCSNFDALNCAYRTDLGTPRPDAMVRVNPDQFPVIADSLVFNELGRVVAMPSIDIMRRRLDEAARIGVGVAPGHQGGAD